MTHCLKLVAATTRNKQVRATGDRVENALQGYLLLEVGAFLADLRVKKNHLKHGYLNRLVLFCHYILVFVHASPGMVLLLVLPSRTCYPRQLILR